MSIFNPMGGRMAMLDMLQRRRQMDQAAVSSVADPLGQAATEINRGVGQQINLQDLAIRQAEEGRRKQAEYERLRNNAAKGVLARQMHYMMSNADALSEPPQSYQSGPSNGESGGPVGGGEPVSGNVTEATGATTPRVGGVHDFVPGEISPEQKTQQASLEGFPDQYVPPGARYNQAPTPQDIQALSPTLKSEAEKFKLAMKEAGFDVDDDYAQGQAAENIQNFRKAMSDMQEARMKAWESARKRAIDELKANAELTETRAKTEKIRMEIDNNLPKNIFDASRRMDDAVGAWSEGKSGQWEDNLQEAEVGTVAAIARQIGADPKDKGDLIRLRAELARRYQYWGSNIPGKMGKPGRWLRDAVLNEVPMKAPDKNDRLLPSVSKDIAANRSAYKKMKSIRDAFIDERFDWSQSERLASMSISSAVSQLMLSSGPVRVGDFENFRKEYERRLADMGEGYTAEVIRRYRKEQLDYLQSTIRGQPSDRDISGMLMAMPDPGSGKANFVAGLDREISNLVDTHNEFIDVTAASNPIARQFRISTAEEESARAEESLSKLSSTLSDTAASARKVKDAARTPGLSPAAARKVGNALERVRRSGVDLDSVEGANLVTQIEDLAQQQQRAQDLWRRAKRAKEAGQIEDYELYESTRDDVYSYDPTRFFADHFEDVYGPYREKVSGNAIDELARFRERLDRLEEVLTAAERKPSVADVPTVKLRPRKAQ